MSKRLGVSLFSVVVKTFSKRALRFDPLNLEFGLVVRVPCWHCIK